MSEDDREAQQPGGPKKEHIEKSIPFGSLTPGAGDEAVDPSGRKPKPGDPAAADAQDDSCDGSESDRKLKRSS